MFVQILFISGFINSGITILMLYILEQNGVLKFSADAILDAGEHIGLSMLLSIPVGLMVSAAVSKFLLKPIRDVIAGMDRLASGDFKTRIRVGKIMRKYPAYVEVSESFNKMAEELENTEMLRGNFINNFSHEFKTPIVSIAGFAKLLKRGNLSAQQQEAYLSAIEEESLRLSVMATNVLSLTKVENQMILTGVQEFNLSEQIRSCILLLENKWSEKEMDLHLDFGEYSVRAEEELLKQVWINLLDNAIKFAPNGNMIRIQILEGEHSVAVEVSNTGSRIPQESLKKVFNKFYQADESHATQGNGVGLAIVKRVVELHGGSVSASSDEEMTTFTVLLPK